MRNICRKYQHDGFTLLHEKLRKQRLYYRNRIQNRRRPFTSQYISNLWEGNEEEHLHIIDLRNLISQVQDKIKKPPTRKKS